MSTHNRNERSIAKWYSFDACSTLVACIKELFQRMSVDQIVNTLLLLLCEEKLLFVSNQLYILPMILEGLLLLLPYPWPHGFIPTVPIYLLPILIDTPSPFLFGTSVTSFAYIRSILSDDVKVIFLHQELMLRLSSCTRNLRYLFRQFHSLPGVGCI